MYIVECNENIVESNVYKVRVDVYTVECNVYIVEYNVYIGKPNMYLLGLDMHIVESNGFSGQFRNCLIHNYPVALIRTKGCLSFSTDLGMKLKQVEAEAVTIVATAITTL